MGAKTRFMGGMRKMGKWLTYFLMAVAAAGIFFVAPIAVWDHERGWIISVLSVQGVEIIPTMIGGFLLVAGAYNLIVWIKNLIRPPKTMEELIKKAADRARGEEKHD